MSKKTILIFLTIVLLLGLTVSPSHTQTKETTKPQGPCNWVAAYGLGLTITRIEREKDYTSVWLAFRRISSNSYPKVWNLTIIDDRGNTYTSSFHLPAAIDLPPAAGNLLKDSPPDYWFDLPVGFTWVPSSPVVVKIPKIAPIAQITIANITMFGEWNFEQKRIDLSFKASCFPNLDFKIEPSNLLFQGRELIKTKNFLLCLDSAKIYKKIEKDGTYISCIIRIKGQNFDYNPQYPPTFTFFLQLSSGRVIHLIDFSERLEPVSERILERLHRRKVEEGEEGKVILVYSSEMRFKGFISDIPPEGSQPKTGKYVINPQFELAFEFMEHLASVKVGGKFGFIDKSGKYIINPQFDFAASFREGLARVKTGNKWGFIDKTGKYIINPQFDGALAFSENLAAVSTGGKWGFIDKSGKYIINPQFNLAGAFREGLARVETGNKSGFIDKSGKYIIDPQFDFAYDFSENLAAVVVKPKGVYVYGYIDKTWR